MAAIHSKNTKPELAVRKALFARGFRYRLHSKNLPGKPDIVLPRYKAVIFVHGCFWHGHDCPAFRLPKTRREYWQPKIAGNRARDKKHIADLAALGWRACTIWECAISGKNAKLEEVIDSVANWLINTSGNTEIARNS